jgi:hypothetical protein
VPGKEEKQPLSVTHPELAKEADGWNPEFFSDKVKFHNRPNYQLHLNEHHNVLLHDESLFYVNKNKSLYIILK